MCSQRSRPPQLSLLSPALNPHYPLHIDQGLPFIPRRSLMIPPHDSICEASFRPTVRYLPN